MPIEQHNIGGHIITCDNETNAIISIEETQSYQQKIELITKLILSKREEFKQRGAKVVKQKFVDNWEILVDNSLNDLKQVWYNGASIEAALQCMEKLSQGLSIEEAYTPIDIQNPDVPCVYFEMELSGWQNHSITSVVGTYHERGQEFCEYRNDFVQNYDEQHKKHK